MATPSPGFDTAIGERSSYHGLDIFVFKERGAYRVLLADGADGVSSTCAGYSADGIRERAVELAYAYPAEAGWLGAEARSPDSLDANSGTDLVRRSFRISQTELI
jgi:hypothetical protein